MSRVSSIERTRLRLALPLALGLGALLVGPPALAGAADSTFSFSGRGFGHGVGLSQYGARGAALLGWDEQRILSHYYRGTTIERRPQRAVRVLLASTRGRYPIGGPFVARTGGTSVRVASGVVRARADGKRVALVGQDGRVIARGARIMLASSEGVRAGGGRYRGRVRLAAPTAGTLEVVNALSLEQYLRGVVPEEVPASWGDDTPAALRAQAIAARTYALATRRSGGRFDVFKDVRSQVYSGKGAEDPRTDSAIRATSGQVVTFDGAPIVAFFFSTSGGRTATAVDVWPDSGRPYLVSVRDPFDRESPVHRWPEAVVVSGDALADALGLDSPVAEVRVLTRSTSPRVRSVEVRTEAGAREELTGAQIRTAAGLRSTWFSVEKAQGPLPPTDEDLT